MCNTLNILKLPLSGQKYSSNFDISGNFYENFTHFSRKFDTIFRILQSEFHEILTRISQFSGEFDIIIKKISFRFEKNFSELLKKFHPTIEKILLNF